MAESRYDSRRFVFVMVRVYASGMPGPKCLISLAQSSGCDQPFTASVCLAVHDPLLWRHDSRTYDWHVDRIASGHAQPSQNLVSPRGTQAPRLAPGDLSGPLPGLAWRLHHGHSVCVLCESDAHARPIPRPAALAVSKRRANRHRRVGTRCAELPPARIVPTFHLQESCQPRRRRGRGRGARPGPPI